MSDLGQCPSCGDQFRPGVESCPACRVPLQPAGAGGDGGGGSGPAADPGHVAVVDLQPLSDAERDLVEQVLGSRRVRHGWQGANLVVPAHLAGEAQLAVEEVVGARSGLDPDVAATVYEVAAWPAAVQARLEALLVDAGIAHEWDANGDLVVAEADEEAVEAVFDQIDESELTAGPDPLPLLESLHAHLTRLAREPLDERARAGLVDAAAALTVAPPPFGLEPSRWHRLLTAVIGLADRLPALDGEVVKERSAALRDDVRSWL